MDLLELSTTEKFEFTHKKIQSKNKTFIEIAYQDSKVGKRAMLAVQRKISRLMQDENNLEDGKLKEDLAETLNLEYFTGLIVGWENITINKKNLEYSIENAKLLMENDIIQDFVINKIVNMGKMMD